MTRKMKDSGVEWIGKIPEDWDIYRMKACISDRATGNWGDDPKGNSDDYTCIRIADFDYEKMSIKKSKDYKFTKRNYKSNVVQKLLLNYNDILIEKSGGGDKTPVGRTIIYTEDRPALYANFIERLRVNDFVVPKFMQYFFFNFYQNKCILGYVRQTTGIQNLDISGMLTNEKVVMPSYEEQQKIADYLDKKVSDIDLIIEKTIASIEGYKDYKQAIITEAVTKGLNPDVKLKNSGVEWIGKIPQHWQLKKFKHILEERNEKNSPVQTDERLSLSIDKGITLYSQKTTNLDRFKEDVSLYKLAHRNDFVLNSMNMIVGAIGVSKYFGCVSPVYYTYYDEIKDSPTPKFCEFLFLSKTIKKLLFSLGKGIMAIKRGNDRVNTCRLKVSKDDLNMLLLPVPGKKEQQEIVDYLDKKISEIDFLIEKKESLINELEEYKRSIIYEYVTGKKEII